MYNRTLNWDLVVEIRQAYEQGQTQEILGSQYNLSQTSISRIVNYQTYQKDPVTIQSLRQETRNARLIRRRALEKGLPIEDVQQLLATKDCCDICGKTTNLKVDHDHQTNKIRGLLCQNCNLLLGFAVDDPDLLAKAISYLKIHGGKLA